MRRSTSEQLITNGARGWMMLVAMSLCFIGLAGARLEACGPYGVKNPEVIGHLLKSAMNGSEQHEAFMTETLRTMGPSGLKMILMMAPVAGSDQLRTLPDDWESQPISVNAAGLAESVRPMVDKVAQQKDADLCGLYWYTDFRQAQLAAKRQNKPLLSLRLLGQLDEEYSCANSRFFRTVLYADQNVASQLRERFVLHWQTVRPVPNIKIDFGDGNVMHRTITGNSAHYMHDMDGRVIDVLPGLHNARAFQRWLSQAGNIAFQSSRGDFSDKQRGEFLVSWHSDQIREIETAWIADLQQLGKVDVSTTRSTARSNLRRQAVPAPTEAKERSETPILAKAVQPYGQVDADRSETVNADELPAFPRLQNAVFAQRMSVSKAMVEMPMMIMALSPTQIESVRRRTDESTWQQIAKLHAAGSKLTPGAISVITRKHMTADQNPQGDLAVLAAKSEAAARRGTMNATSPGETSGELDGMIRAFEHVLAIDTVRNEYELHRTVHSWFVNQPIVEDREAFNQRLYDEVFASPLDDPFMGLHDDDVYTALPAGGLSRR